MRKLMTLAAAAMMLAAAQPAESLAQRFPSQTQEKNESKKVKSKSDSDSRLNQRRDVWLGLPGAGDNRRGRNDRANDARRDDRRGQNDRNRDDDRRFEDRRDRDDDSDGDNNKDDRQSQNRRGQDDRFDPPNRGNANGPAFCRSGAGHPVHGRQWCRDKGYGLGGNARWDQVRWDDVIFRRPQQRTNLELSRDVLSDVLGGVVFGRLDGRRRASGISEPLNGRWVNYDNRSVLLVNAGSYPLAELIDSNRDRRVDLVLVNAGR